MSEVLLFSSLLWLHRVVIPIHVVPTLERVRVHHPELLVEDHSSTPFLADILVSVLGLHVFAGKVALFELKTDTVLTQHLRKELTLDLLDELVDRVAEGKVALEGWVRVQVQVHEQSLILGVVLAEAFDSEAGGLLLGVRVGVVAVEVLVEGVHPAVPPHHAIRVEHRHQHKHEILPQKKSPCIFFVEQEVNDALHAVAGRRLDGVHPRTDEDNRLVVSELCDLLVLERIAVKLLVPLLALVGRDDNQVNDPFLVTFDEFPVPKI